jgi:hypothetical protein
VLSAASAAIAGNGVTAGSVQIVETAEIAASAARKGVTVTIAANEATAAVIGASAAENGPVNAQIGVASAWIAAENVSTVVASAPTAVASAPTVVENAPTVVENVTAANVTPSAVPQVRTAANALSVGIAGIAANVQNALHGTSTASPTSINPLKF